MVTPRRTQTAGQGMRRLLAHQAFERIRLRTSGFWGLVKFLAAPTEPLTHRLPGSAKEYQVQGKGKPEWKLRHR